METVLARWLGWVTLGELVGFMAPTAAGVLTVDRPGAVQLGVLAAAGLVEGTVLGWTQAHVLRTVLPVAPGRWVLATACGAGVAWVLGMLPSTTYDVWSPWPAAAAVPVGALLATGLLLSIGTAQWLLLRHVLPHAGWWVAATALAWAVGLTVFGLVAFPLWYAGQHPVATAAVGLLAGLAMAASMALTTGLTLRHLLALARHGPGASRPGPHDRGQTLPGKPIWRHAS